MYGVKSALLSAVVVALLAWQAFAGEEAAPAALWSGEKITFTEALVGKFPSNMIPGTLRISPDGQRIACAIIRDGREAVRIDSSTERLFDEVLGSPRDGIVWGPDSRWVVYQARNGNDRLLVRAGVPEPVHGAIEPGSITLSPNGRRLLYIAKFDQHVRVVADGKEERLYDEITYGPVFTPDGTRYVYVGRRDGQDHLVIDAVQQEAYDWIRPPIFFCGGNSVVYAASRAGAQHMVIAGGAGQDFDYVAGPVIAPNLKHVLYVGIQEGKARVVKDHLPGAPYDVAAWVGKSITGVPAGAHRGNDQGRFTGVGPGTSRFPATDNVGVVWSQDSEHFAYLASEKGKWFAVIDSTESRVKYDKVGAGAPVYDRHGRLFFAGWRDGRAFIVVDGEELGGWDDVLWSSFTLSPGGGHWACLVMDGGRWHVVVDGVEGGGYRDIQPGTLTFSNKGDHIAYVVSPGLRFKQKWSVVVDGVMGGEYSVIRRDSILFGSTGKHYSYVARVGSDSAVVVDGMAQQPAKRIGNYRWGPNGEHMAWTAGTDRTDSLVLDGVEGPSFDSLLPGAQVAFDDATTVHALVQRGVEIIRIEGKIAPK